MGKPDSQCLVHPQVMWGDWNFVNHQLNKLGKDLVGGTYAIRDPLTITHHSGKLTKCIIEWCGQEKVLPYLFNIINFHEQDILMSDHIKDLTIVYTYHHDSHGNCIQTFYG